MSNSHGVGSTPPSRRSVVKGAAWAVPAVVVAGAAPTVAASPPGLAFTGGACKLPGNSSSLFKGYVFELTATNNPGGRRGHTVTVVIERRRQRGSPRDSRSSSRAPLLPAPARAGCTPAGANNCNSFCTPDGTTQRIFIFTSSQSDSQNANMTLTYNTYACTDCAAPVLTESLASGPVSTPPVTIGGGSCRSRTSAVQPSLNDTCA